MTNFELKEGKGTAFKNKNKTSDKHPSYTGTVLIDGKERWISVWGNKTQKGDTYLSFDIKAKEVKEEKEEEETDADGLGDDRIPFN